MQQRLASELSTALSACRRAPSRNINLILQQSTRPLTQTARKAQASTPARPPFQPSTSAPPKPVSNPQTTKPTAPPQRTLTSGLDDPLPSAPTDSTEDWTRSYAGLSHEPFSAETAAVLMAEIVADDIEIKPDGIVYLPEIKYRRILNKAFGPGGWGLAPRGETIVTAKLVTREYGLVCGGR